MFPENNYSQNGSVANFGSALPNLYIKVKDITKGTLTGKNVDEALNSAEPLFGYAESVERAIGRATSTTQFSAGAIKAACVELEIYRTGLATHFENHLALAKKIDDIFIYVTIDNEGKIQIREEIKLSNCRVMRISSSTWSAGLYSSEAQSYDARNLNLMRVEIHFPRRLCTRTPFDQAGVKQGASVSEIDLIKGLLEQQKTET